MSDDREFGEVSVTVGGGVVPFNLTLTKYLHGRWGERGAKVLDQVVSAVGQEAFQSRLANSEEFEVLVARALNAAAASSSAAKRKLLGQVLVNAAEDVAAIDEAWLIEMVLEQIDAPHVRCLQALSAAEREAEQAGDLAETARGAERPYNGRVHTAAKAFPAPLLQALGRLDLITVTVSWDGTILWASGVTAFGHKLLDELERAADEV